MKAVEFIHDVKPRTVWFDGIRNYRSSLRENYPVDKYRIEMFFASSVAALPFSSSELRNIPFEKVYQSRPKV